jgi:predicted XRE-type DNA-binding protein
MSVYTTLENGKYDRDRLPPAHKAFLTKVLRHYNKKPSWDKFAKFWLSKGNELWGGIRGKKLLELPIYKICQDLEARLGIEQGHTRQRDFWDELEEWVKSNFQSQYQFCRATGIDQGFLSNVLKKRKEFSISKLETALHKVGYKLTIQRETAIR